ncbi:amino acid ABC transporter ATP-binding protein [Nonomuraea sp. NPDC002799]
MSAMVQIDNVHKSYGGLHVLRGVTASCAPSEVVCLIGRSGSGKSTLLRCVNHLEKPDAGRITVDGELIGYEQRGDRLVERRERDTERQRREVGMVFQRFNLFPHLTAAENIALAPRRLRGLSKAEARELAGHSLERVGLADKRDAYARHLSGGQQQRVAIARALAMEPKVLLFDEPTSALDPELVGEVLTVMRTVAEQGMTMMVVTHELRFAREVAGQVLFMEDGVIVEAGPPEDVLGRPQHERTQAFVSRIFH